MSRKNDYNFLDQHKILVLQNYEIIGSWFVAKIVRVISPLCVTMGANFDAYFQRLQCLEGFFPLMISFILNFQYLGGKVIKF